jgi:hypothetical protein
VQVTVVVACPNGPLHFLCPHQPPTEPMARVDGHRLIGFADPAQTEIVRPPHQHPVEMTGHFFRLEPVPSAPFRLFANLQAQLPDVLVRRSHPRLASAFLWPSPSGDEVGTPIKVISELHGWPAWAPVNASPATSRPPAHDSGSSWFATPCLYGSFIRDSMPVYPGAPPDPFCPLHFIQESRATHLEASHWSARWVGK